MKASDDRFLPGRRNSYCNRGMRPTVSSRLNSKPFLLVLSSTSISSPYCYPSHHFVLQERHALQQLFGCLMSNLIQKNLNLLSSKQQRWVMTFPTLHQSHVARSTSTKTYRSLSTTSNEQVFSPVAESHKSLNNQASDAGYYRFF